MVSVPIRAMICALVKTSAAGLAGCCAECRPAAPRPSAAAQRPDRLTGVFGGARRDRSAVFASGAANAPAD